MGDNKETVFFRHNSEVQIWTKKSYEHIHKTCESSTQDKYQGDKHKVQPSVNDLLVIDSFLEIDSWFSLKL